MSFILILSMKEKLGSDRRELFENAFRNSKRSYPIRHVIVDR